MRSDHIRYVDRLDQLFKNLKIEKNTVITIEDYVIQTS